MKTCVKCGKKGLFLWLSKSGYCTKCAQEVLAEREKEAQEAAVRRETYDSNLYAEAVRLYSCLPNQYYITPEILPCVDAHMQAYDDLIAFLDKKCRNEGFLSKYRMHGKQESHNYWSNHELGGLLFSDESPDKYINGEIEKLKTARHRLIEAQRATAEFERAYAAISKVEIFQEADVTPFTLSGEEWPEFIPKAIISRTSRGSVCDYVVIDTETTGLSPRTNEIIQLSAVKFENFMPVGAFCTYVKPKKKLNPKAQEINKITWDDVKDAPYIEQVIKDFDAFVGSKLPVIGHNVVFDCGFLYAAGSKAINPKRKYYDTCSLAKKAYELGSYSLSNICENQFHIFRSISHDALSDSLFCGILFADICEKVIA